MTNRNKALTFIAICTSSAFGLIYFPGIVGIAVATFGLCSLWDLAEKSAVRVLMNAIVTGLVVNACITFEVVKHVISY